MIMSPTSRILSTVPWCRPWPRFRRPRTCSAPFSPSFRCLTFSSRTWAVNFSDTVLDPTAYPLNSTISYDPVQTQTTHFGFETVTTSEKADRVARVFSNVAESYDSMNDLMSFGWHRIWKDHFVSSLNPGFSPSKPPSAQHILDVAGGTGDIAFRMLRHAHNRNGNGSVRVTILDINPDMLAAGRTRAVQAGFIGNGDGASDTGTFQDERAPLSFVQGDAEHLPRNILPDNSVDLYTVAFGIRNFTNMATALREAFRVLRPGGVFACLEFSKADAFPLLNAIYKRWSFGAIPLIGHVVAGDRDSYQYLVESIERFPSQEHFRDMIAAAGFVIVGRGYDNLTGGVAAIHRGLKPL